MITRVLTAAVLIVGIGLGIWLQGWVLRAMLLFCMVLSLDEMYRAFQKLGYRPVRWIGYVYCALASLTQAAVALLPQSSASALFIQGLDPAVFALCAGTREKLARAAALPDFTPDCRGLEAAERILRGI